MRATSRIHLASTIRRYYRPMVRTARPWRNYLTNVAADGAQAGFTLVEVLAAGIVLSAVVFCLVRAWTVFDLMSVDLQVRQKAVFILNGEMERLSGLYTVGGFGGAGPGQLQSVSGYPAIAGIPNSSGRLVYGPSTTSAQNFTTSSFNTFTSATTAESTVLIQGSGVTTANFIWIDRTRNILGRLSWVACPTTNYATNGAATASSCWYGSPIPAGNSCYAYSSSSSGNSSGNLNSGGASCYLLTLLLEYPYRLVGSVPVSQAGLQGSHLSSSILTLSTIVGRWT